MTTGLLLDAFNDHVDSETGCRMEENAGRHEALAALPASSAM